MENNLNAKNKRTTIYLVVLTAFTLVVLIGATYAYYVNDATFGEEIKANVQASTDKGVFIASVNGNLTYNTTPEQIGQYMVNTAAVASANATLNIDLTSTTNFEVSYCYYDIVWTYTSEDKYTVSDVTLPHETSKGNYPYEFSLKINSNLNGRASNKPEKDLSIYPWTEDGKATLVDQMVIASIDPSVKTTQSYNLATKMYNIDAEQTNLFNRNMVARIQVENNYCINKEFKADTKHLLTLNETSGEYEEVDTVPSGYILDSDRTFCAKGDATAVSYNSSTGAVTIPSGSECFVYFKKSSLPKYDYSFQ